ncbi:MAG: HlyD family type I secretion periplasmic adaptor subunit [Pleurocapsa sp.]
MKPNNTLVKLNSASSERSLQESPLEQDIITTQPAAIFLQQPSIWSKAIAWGIVGITAIGITWASVAEIEKVIPAQGKLEPRENIREIKAPIGGVIETVFVQDGQSVKPNDILLEFDTTATQKQLNSLAKIKHSLIQENYFYRAQIGSNQTNNLNLLKVELPPEILMLLNNRANLVAENKLYRVQINNSLEDINLTADQQKRWQITQLELNSRQAVQLQEINQLKQQLKQNETKLANAHNLLATAQKNLVTKQNNLTTEQQILNNLKPLIQEGAIPHIQYLKQQQEADNRQAELTTYQGEINTQQAEIEQLLQEQTRIQSAIAQAQAQLTNTTATTQTEIYNKIAFNQQKIAEIDTQLGKQTVENKKRIAEIESQITQLEQSLKYHQLKANTSGQVFDLKAYPGSVTGKGEIVLEVVPNAPLVAEVYLTNQDRGFVKEGMEVDVRIDAFDFSEFGDIKGKLIAIGADVLEPDAIHNYYRFPAKIQLEQQHINIKGQQITLKSGMSVSVNIKERKRKVIGIFLSALGKKLETLQEN